MTNSYSPDNDIECRTTGQHFNPACNSNSSKMKLGLQLSWPAAQQNSQPSENIMRNNGHYTCIIHNVASDAYALYPTGRSRSPGTSSASGSAGGFSNSYPSELLFNLYW